MLDDGKHTGPYGKKESHSADFLSFSLLLLTYRLSSKADPEQKRYPIYRHLLGFYSTSEFDHFPRIVEIAAHECFFSWLPPPASM